MQQRGMYWDDLRKIIDRNKISSACVRYYYEPKRFVNKISILDTNIPHRTGKFESYTGDFEHDWYADSLICDAAWFGGEIPMHGSEGIYVDTGKWAAQPYRGALGVLLSMVHAGTLRRTDELRDLFRANGRRL